MMQVDSDIKAREIISYHFPELEIENIHYLGSGDNNNAYELNNKYIFRFPKHNKAEITLANEIRLLEILKKEFSLKVPDFVFIGNREALFLKGKDEKRRVTGLIYKLKQLLKFSGLQKGSKEIVTQIFVGYPKITGSELKPDELKSFSIDTKNSIARDIGNFLEDLHSFPINYAIKTGADHWKLNREYYQSFHQSITCHVFPKISKKEQDLLLEFYESFLREERNFEYIPSLIHGDLTFDHIIFNSKTQRISGIIDFGGICISDPTYDLFLIYSDYGEDFLSIILKYYKNKNVSSNIFKKIRALCLCFGASSIDTGERLNNTLEVRKGWGTINQLISNLNYSN